MLERQQNCGWGGCKAAARHTPSAPSCWDCRWGSTSCVKLSRQVWWPAYDTVSSSVITAHVHYCTSLAGLCQWNVIVGSCLVEDVVRAACADGLLQIFKVAAAGGARLAWGAGGGRFAWHCTRVEAASHDHPGPGRHGVIAPLAGTAQPGPSPHGPVCLSSFSWPESHLMHGTCTS